MGIDPGYDRFGIAIIERIHGKETLIHSSCATTTAHTPMAERLYSVGTALHEAIRMHEPHALALEQLFFNKNVKTALGVAEARGTALYVAKGHGLPIFEYSPQAVKIATTGHGNSEKRQVEEMLHRLVAGVPHTALDDEYDAIAVALTCLVSERW